MSLAIDSTDAAASHRQVNAGNVLTYTNTWSFNNAGGNLLLVLGCSSAHQTDTVNSFTATYGGTTMLVGPSQPYFSNAAIVTLFYLPSPPTGSNNVVLSTTLNASTTTDCIIGSAISFRGAASTLGATSISKNDVGGSNHTQAGNVTAAVGNYVVGGGDYGGNTGGGTVTPDSPQTMMSSVIGSNNNGGDNQFCSYLQSTGAAINIGAVWSAGTDIWGAVAAEVQAGPLVARFGLGGGIYVS